MAKTDQYDYIKAAVADSGVDRINAAIKKKGAEVRGSGDYLGNGAIHRLQFSTEDIFIDVARAFRELLDEVRRAEYSALETGTVAITDMPRWQELLGRHGLGTFAAHEARDKTNEEIWHENMACIGPFQTGKLTEHPRSRRDAAEYDETWRRTHPDEFEG